MAYVSRRSLIKAVGLAAAASTSAAVVYPVQAAASRDARVLSSADREVRLIANGDPDYTSLMAAHFPGLLADPVFQSIQPVSAILTQKAGPRVKAFTVSWRITNGSSTYGTQYYHAAPVGTRAANSLGFTVITGEVPLLAPLGYRLVTPFFSWTPARFARHPQPNWTTLLKRVEPAGFLASQLNANTQITVGLDAAVFSDFKLLGQNTFHTGGRFAVKRNAEHDEGLYVQGLLKSGATVSQIRSDLADRAYKPQGRLYANQLWYSNARRRQALVFADQLANLPPSTFADAVARLVAHPKTVVHAQA